MPGASETQRGDEGLQAGFEPSAAERRKGGSALEDHHVRGTVSETGPIIVTEVGRPAPTGRRYRVRPIRRAAVFLWTASPRPVVAGQASLVSTWAQPTPYTTRSGQVGMRAAQTAQRPGHSRIPAFVDVPRPETAVVRYRVWPGMTALSGCRPPW
ncbi:hypothetical protein XCR_0807 [Xanthomonas campestris pv. raphani 756C]|nr:hypothetical protein XCR_0807 [Xanthomonas campestris pv. raphani 756C]